ncbi:fumarate hydratase [Treponema endosymbiont of Eucomonympha sp.]|uniref:fumarate hydratase n=1 Tax=Treponema endosymbiont of Eucomonympha sp. TaxID=1580831 RepID=UPI00075121EF|nr:fumarate hydratase [Treponema endosymbiont of Eucomonympha sp.]
MQRTVNTAAVVPVLAGLIQKACYELGDDVVGALRAAEQREESPYGRDTLRTLLDNAAYAKEAQIACCQDTGACVVALEVGQEVSWTGAPLTDAVNEGVRKGYGEGYLRKSLVRDPLDRVNTGDNTPAMLHAEIVAGDRVHITVLPKGGGSENMSALAVLVPSAGAEGVRDFVLKTVEAAGGKPCPPCVVGVGIGGTADVCAWLAKKAHLRPIGERNPDPRYAALERDLLERINDLGIGPMGMGGRITALDVHIEQYPCHITSLPVAVNFQCHSARRASAWI